MAKKDAAAAATENTTTVAKPTGQGRAVILPNGTRRIDYIHEEFYTNGKTRSEIRLAVNAMLPEGEEIAYQIVFAATKTVVDPRVARAAKEKEKADAATAARKKAAAASSSANATK